MPSSHNADLIYEALDLACVRGFTGDYEELGGGELNDTFKLLINQEPRILRIAKDEGRQTLATEARTLKLLSTDHAPNLLFFDPSKLVQNRLFVYETYMDGKIVTRLNDRQFYSLGRVLAAIHAVNGEASTIDLNQQFFSITKAFGDESELMNHPDNDLRKLINEALQGFKLKQKLFEHIQPALTHGDITPSNTLVNGNSVNLIDWEFSKYTDPMADFSTIYYEDMEYNKGTWRLHIRPDEKAALFAGYTAAGGIIDEDRVRFWINFDKLGAAIFLYWRTHESIRATSDEENAQYKYDLKKLVASLKAVGQLR